MQTYNMIKRLLDFLNASPVNFLAAKNIATWLEQAGYRY
jgi:aspartyl aminopeptidase